MGFVYFVKTIVFWQISLANFSSCKVYYDLSPEIGVIKEGCKNKQAINNKALAKQTIALILIIIHDQTGYKVSAMERKVSSIKKKLSNFNLQNYI
jgi:hypothetical protein